MEERPRGDSGIEKLIKTPFLLDRMILLRHCLSFLLTQEHSTRMKSMNPMKFEKEIHLLGCIQIAQSFESALTLVQKSSILVPYSVQIAKIFCIMNTVKD